MDGTNDRDDRLAEIIAAYDREAETLAPQYAAAKRRSSSPWWSDALPDSPARVVDIGAGTGEDAVWLARRGYDVVAVEPSARMASVSRDDPDATSVTWIDDTLPHLTVLQSTQPAFDFVLCNGVMQHVPPWKTGEAIASLVRVTRASCACALSLRLGPSPPSRPMFPVDPGEVRRLSIASGFHVDREFSLADPLGRADVSWVMLLLRKVAGY